MDTTNFGILLKTLRKQKFMTQEALADRLCVTTSAISKWENGKNLPDIMLMQKLAQIFEISLDDLCNCEETLATINNPASQNKKPTFCRFLPFREHPLFSLKGIAILSSLFVCILSVCLGILQFSTNDTISSQNIRPMVSRITQDDTCGTVYEIVHLFQGDVETLHPDVPYIKSLFQQWIMDNSVDSRISVMKLSFYESHEDIVNWTTPKKTIYLSR